MTDSLGFPQRTALPDSVEDTLCCSLTGTSLVGESSAGWLVQDSAEIIQ